MILNILFQRQFHIQQIFLHLHHPPLSHFNFCTSVSCDDKLLSLGIVLRFFFPLWFQQHLSSMLQKTIDINPTSQKWKFLIIKKQIQIDLIQRHASAHRRDREPQSLRRRLDELQICSPRLGQGREPPPIAIAALVVILRLCTQQASERQNDCVAVRQRGH